MQKSSRSQPFLPLRCLTPRLPLLRRSPGRKSSRTASPTSNPPTASLASPPLWAFNKAINPGALPAGGAAAVLHMSLRPGQRPASRGQRGLSAPTPHHSSTAPSRPRRGSSPSISTADFQVQPQAPLLSVKMSRAHANHSYLSSSRSLRAHHSTPQPQASELAWRMPTSSDFLSHSVPPCPPPHLEGYRGRDCVTVTDAGVGTLAIS